MGFFSNIEILIAVACIVSGLIFAVPVLLVAIKHGKEGAAEAEKYDCTIEYDGIDGFVAPNRTALEKAVFGDDVPRDASKLDTSNLGSVTTDISTERTGKLQPTEPEIKVVFAARPVVPSVSQSEAPRFAPHIAQQSNAQAASHIAQQSNAQAAPHIAQQSNAQAAPHIAQQSNAQAAPHFAQQVASQFIPSVAPQVAEHIVSPTTKSIPISDAEEIAQFSEASLMEGQAAKQVVTTVFNSKPTAKAKPIGKAKSTAKTDTLEEDIPVAKVKVTTKAKPVAKSAPDIQNERTAK